MFFDDILARVTVDRGDQNQEKRKFVNVQPLFWVCGHVVVVVSKACGKIRGSKI